VYNIRHRPTTQRFHTACQAVAMGDQSAVYTWRPRAVLISQWKCGDLLRVVDHRTFEAKSGRTPSILFASWRLCSDSWQTSSVFRSMVFSCNAHLAFVSFLATPLMTAKAGSTFPRYCEVSAHHCSACTLILFRLRSRQENDLYMVC